MTHMQKKMSTTIKMLEPFMGGFLASGLRVQFPLKKRGFLWLKTKVLAENMNST